MAVSTHIVAVGGLVKDGKGNILIGKSIWRKQWEFFGGQVEMGENLEEALIREINEESGVIVKVVSLVGIYSNIKGSMGESNIKQIPTKLILDFICEYVSGEPINSNETMEVSWVSEEKAIELINSPIFKMRLENMLKYDGKITYQSFENNPYIEHYKRKF